MGERSKTALLALAVALASSLGCNRGVASGKPGGDAGSADAGSTGDGGSELTIIRTTLPVGTLSAAYSALLTATGGTQPYNWSLTQGSLPPGLNLAAGGAITGTPTTRGAWTFTVRVADSS